MNILVIGNGFDIAHGLPTGYKEFVRFCDEFLLYKKTKEEGKELYFHDEEDTTFFKYFVELFNKAETEVYSKAIVDELHDLLVNNSWFNYFHDEKIKDNWTDFETEISKVIKELDLIRKNEEVTVLNTGEKAITLTDYQLLNLRPALPEVKGWVTYKDIKVYKQKLLTDLNRLTRGLEIYLADFINKIEIKDRLPDLADVEITHILSFNYTETFQRLYGATGTITKTYDYIHGKADISKSVENSDLIIGIDEYLKDDEKDQDNEFIQFKKFYQRIYKMTGNKYIDWVSGAKPYSFNVFIYGHSLDVTDKDILARVILAKRAKSVTIFYHNQEALGNQIANLVKVVGQEELIRRTSGKDRKIIFKETLKIKK